MWSGKVAKTIPPPHLQLGRVSVAFSYVTLKHVHTIAKISILSQFSESTLLKNV